MRLYGRGLRAMVRRKRTDDAIAAAENVAEVLTMVRAYFTQKKE